MKKLKKSTDKWQFGDFQTPDQLAESTLRVLAATMSRPPERVVEPSCGTGAFVRAARTVFPEAEILGYEINPAYAETARKSSVANTVRSKTSIEALDFFQAEWQSLLGSDSKKLLITGNPPWVTSSELGILNSTNLPPKTNYTNARGIEAITGSSNFDISEFMLLRYIEWLADRPGQIGVLCKTSVARKVFRQACAIWTRGVAAAIYTIDAKHHFDASVDACFFVLGKAQENFECAVHKNLDSKYASYKIGIRGGILVKNVDDYDDYEHLIGRDSNYVWRSGLKHDCSKVMELRDSGRGIVNGFGKAVNIEDVYRYPLLKSSDVANGRISGSKSAIVTQSYVGEPTKSINARAPSTWRYLINHKKYLDGRTSIVYKGKPRFSIFGVGEYTFYPWKIAISGMYKRLSFIIVPPIDGKPVVFDDTVYFLPCASEIEAVYIHDLLNSEEAQCILDALIFWDEKRPVTAKVLRTLDLEMLAYSAGTHTTYLQIVAQKHTKKPRRNTATEYDQIALI